ncbi:tumor necrosis factor ligand superfamily member 6 [Biomphalaria pfeifferi]|uniref:Tumor necrosis factor ligand superfamily member 6 n=1 Tax=Biomphalaria pfeifferi TaxID=112525 RepID=A0AAD8C524_BIOPF|nr:tumor necrosis factor ligand superfamily member 6 [Biomphalaria pfeifferi]
MIHSPGDRNSSERIAKRRTTRSSKYWPKIIFLLTSVAFLLSIGCIVALGIFHLASENSQSENKEKSALKESSPRDITPQDDQVKNSDRSCKQGDVTCLSDSSKTYLPITNDYGETDIQMPTRNISAHLKYYIQDKGGMARGSNIKLLFNSSASNNYVNGIQLSGNGVVIQTKGSYFVYSNILFLTNNYKRCDQLAEKVWKHVVKLIRASLGTLEDLLLAYHTCCNECERERTTSYTAGMFNLNFNDSLYVEVTSEGIRFEPTSSYFGLTLMEAPPLND